jgi:hypothetical protein
VIGVRTDRSEDHGNAKPAEMPACHNASWVVVDPANGQVASKVDSSTNRSLETHAIPSQVGPTNAFRHKVLDQRECLVVADVFRIEALTVEVAGLDLVVVEDCKPPNPLPGQGRGDVADEATRPDAHDMGRGQGLLIEAGNAALPVLSPRNGDAPSAQADL